MTFKTLSKTTLQIRSKETLTLPASFREKYKLEEGELFS